MRVARNRSCKRRDRVAARPPLDFVEQILLGLLVRLPDFFQRNADRVSQIIVVGPPSGQVLIE